MSGYFVGFLPAPAQTTATADPTMFQKFQIRCIYPVSGNVPVAFTDKDSHVLAETDQTGRLKLGLALRSWSKGPSGFSIKKKRRANSLPPPSAPASSSTPSSPVPSTPANRSATTPSSLSSSSSSSNAAPAAGHVPAGILITPPSIDGADSTPPATQKHKHVHHLLGRTFTWNPDHPKSQPATRPGTQASSPSTPSFNKGAAADTGPVTEGSTPAEGGPPAATRKTGGNDYFCLSPDMSSADSTPTVGQFPTNSNSTSSISANDEAELERGRSATPRASEPVAFSRALSTPVNADREKRGILRKDGATHSGAPSRKSSVSSITFGLPGGQLPQGVQKRTDSLRIRASSPPPRRFQSHVAFDSLVGDATKANTPSLTLNVRHKGYQVLRRSRTFMAGVDENAYSDYALQWLLDELVDDGDEVVCIRVVEKEIRPGDHKVYQEEAEAMMANIVAKNGANRAISLILEYAFGKLASTFQKMIRMYQPGLLIVGTRGRSLGGLHGLVNTRNSFSKYCLQYSPVPVVVVRPPDKRSKKKDKRSGDPMRQTYTRMLSSTGGKHETDVESTKLYELQAKLSADEEAHHVARVLGLPASFDPTVKPIDPAQVLRHGHHGGLGSLLSSPLASARQSATSSQAGSVPPSPTGTAPGDSDEENDEDEDEDEAEFEVMSGQQAVEMSEHKKEKLHAMEVNEAAALKLHAATEDDEDDQNPASTSAFRSITWDGASDGGIEGAGAKDAQDETGER